MADMDEVEPNGTDALPTVQARTIVAQALEAMGHTRESVLDILCNGADGGELADELA